MPFCSVRQLKTNGLKDMFRVWKILIAFRRRTWNRKMTALWWNKLLRKQSTQRRVKRNLVTTRKGCLDSKMTDSGIRMKAQQGFQFWMSQQLAPKYFTMIPLSVPYLRPLLTKLAHTGTEHQQTRIPWQKVTYFFACNSSECSCVSSSAYHCVQLLHL